MHTAVSSLLALRQSYQKILNRFSLEELNYIPPGFNNNIMWNIGHVISVHEMLVRGLAGQRWKADKTIVKAYMKGSRPERPYTEEDRQIINDLLVKTIKETHEDHNNGLLNEYQEFKTLTGFEINDFDSAVTFDLFHEGLHMGYIFCIQKFLDQAS